MVLIRVRFSSLSNHNLSCLSQLVTTKNMTTTAVLFMNSNRSIVVTVAIIIVNWFRTNHYFWLENIFKTKSTAKKRKNDDNEQKEKREKKFDTTLSSVQFFLQSCAFVGFPDQSQCFA